MGSNISVVIPTFNSAKTIGACLEAFDGEPGEVFVIDDCSSDGTQEIARQHGATVIKTRKRSAASARNLGVAHSKGEIVAFTDSDCLPTTGWLQAIMDAFKELPDADIIGGEIRYREDTGFRKAYAAMYRLTDGRFFADDSNKLPAMNLSVRRRVFKDLTFDETLPGALCDDVDFLQRALFMSKKIRYRPEIVVTHLNPANFRSFFRQEVRHGMGDIIFRRRYPDIGGSQSEGMRTWISESFLNAPGHVKELLKVAGETNRVTVGAGILNYVRHVIGGYGHLKAERVMPRYPP